MSPSGKKKTTMAKLMRESRLRERRAEKQVRKDARKLAAAAGEADQPDPLNEAAQPAPGPEVSPPQESEPIPRG
jgi:hypothetical protein